MEEDKLEKIRNADPPRLKKVRSFFRLTGYYRMFIASYAAIKKKGMSNNVVWKGEHDTSFKE